MKLLSAANEVSVSGIWIFFLVLVAAIVVLVLWQIRQNHQHTRQLSELYSLVETLREWYGTQGENLEFLKMYLPTAPATLPNAAHRPDIERAAHTMMRAGVVRPQAYELLYQAVDRGKQPEAFATDFVDLVGKVSAHA